MEIFIQFLTNWKLFLLILVRLFAMFTVAPFFSSIIVPFRIKAVLAIIISYVMFPMVSRIEISIPDATFDFIFILINQAIIGLLIGFMVAILFAVFQLAGQFFSLQMGLGMNNVMDPMAQIQIPIIGQLQQLIAMLIFLSINGHIFLIDAVYKSFFKLSVMSIEKYDSIIRQSLFQSLSIMFETALQLALPIIGTLFLITLCMGLLAKFAPQMNILMLGFPIYIGIGLIGLYLLTDMFIKRGIVIIEHSFGLVSNLLN